MEWSDIRVFLQVARAGTMVGATGVLRMDHSTISRRNSRLERETGVHLFERAGRRLTLTAEGGKLKIAAEKLESVILQDVLSLSTERDRIAGPIRIGTTEEFGGHYLASRLCALTADYPELQIELVASSRSFSLATREVDLVISLDRPVSGDLRYKKLIDIEFGIYGSAAYFADRVRPTSLGDLSGETWCGYIKELLFTPELEMLPEASDAHGVKYSTTSVTVQLGAVAGGYALAALPCFVADDHPPLERLLEDEAVFERSYWLSVHEDLASYPRVRAVMNAIEAQVGKDRALFKPSIAPRDRSNIAPFPSDGPRASGGGHVAADSLERRRAGAA